MHTKSTETIAARQDSESVQYGCMVNLPVVEEVKTSCVCWSETLKEGSKVTKEKGK